MIDMGKDFRFWEMPAKLMETIEKSALVRMIAIIGIVMTAITYYLEAPDRELAREVAQETLLELRQGRLDSSWAALTVRSTSQTGKGRALEHLARNGVSLQGIDLSCKTLGGYDGQPPIERTLDRAARRQWSMVIGTPRMHPESLCFRPTNLAGIDLSREAIGSNVDLRGANLREVNFSGANLSGVDFRGADVSGADFSGANLTDTDFFLARFENVWLQSANVSGMNFPHNELPISGYDAADAWAWEDNPPIAAPESADINIISR